MAGKACRRRTPELGALSGGEIYAGLVIVSIAAVVHGLRKGFYRIVAMFAMPGRLFDTGEIRPPESSNLQQIPNRSPNRTRTRGCE
jgi:hypothetical protein